MEILHWWWWGLNSIWRLVTHWHAVVALDVFSNTCALNICWLATMPGLVVTNICQLCRVCYTHTVFLFSSSLSVRTGLSCCLLTSAQCNYPNCDYQSRLAPKCLKKKENLQRQRPCVCFLCAQQWVKAVWRNCVDKLRESTSFDSDWSRNLSTDPLFLFFLFLFKEKVIVVEHEPLTQRK